MRFCGKWYYQNQNPPEGLKMAENSLKNSRKHPQVLSKSCMIQDIEESAQIVGSEDAMPNHLLPGGSLCSGILTQPGGSLCSGILAQQVAHFRPEWVAHFTPEFAVDHGILFELIYKKVKCSQTMQLLRRMIRAPIQIEDKLHKRRKGVPQGSPLSPLLSNILLHELDNELEKRGLRYVRYADDFSIYVRSKKAARRAGNNIYQFLRDCLRLPINREKSGIRRPLNFELLGYAFVSSYKKGERGKYQLVVGRSKWEKLKAELKAITRKTIPMTFDERIQRLNWLIRGWLNYFKHASIHGKLKELDGWLRNRLRYCIWHHWKRPERKRKNLIRLGVDPDHAYAWND
jgi:hypothetical protein